MSWCSAYYFLIVLIGLGYLCISILANDLMESWTSIYIMLIINVWTSLKNPLVSSGVLSILQHFLVEYIYQTIHQIDLAFTVKNLLKKDLKSKSIREFAKQYNIFPTLISDEFNIKLSLSHCVTWRNFLPPISFIILFCIWYLNSHEGLFKIILAIYHY